MTNLKISTNEYVSRIITVLESESISKDLCPSLSLDVREGLADNLRDGSVERMTWSEVHYTAQAVALAEQIHADHFPQFILRDKESGSRVWTPTRIAENGNMFAISVAGIDLFEIPASEILAGVMRHPTYKTKNGNDIRAYVANTIGKTFSVDDGKNNFRGTEGIVGSFVTAEEAIEAAKKAKDSTCSVEVVNTRAPEGNEVIFSL